MADLAPRDSVTTCDMSQPVTEASGPVIIELEKLIHSGPATLAAAKGTLHLMELGLTRYPAAWDSAALAAMVGDLCVGVLVVSVTDDQSAWVDLAWCDPEWPAVLSTLLIRMRRWPRAKNAPCVRFTCHPQNDAMAKVGKAIGAEPFSVGYRIPLDKEPG